MKKNEEDNDHDVMKKKLFIFPCLNDFLWSDSMGRTIVSISSTNDKQVTQIF